MTKQKNSPKGSPVVRLTKKDFRIDWFSGSGKGGQHKNKVKTACRIHHDPSGAMATCQEHREAPQNLKTAFERIVKTKELQTWLRLETMRRLGKEQSIEETVEYELKHNTVTEVLDENGKWVRE